MGTTVAEIRERLQRLRNAKGIGVRISLGATGRDVTRVVLKTA
jgi:hypothetical protein